MKKARKVFFLCILSLFGVLALTYSVSSVTKAYDIEEYLRSNYKYEVAPEEYCGTYSKKTNNGDIGSNTDVSLLGVGELRYKIKVLGNDTICYYFNDWEDVFYQEGCGEYSYDMNWYKDKPIGGNTYSQEEYVFIYNTTKVAPYDEEDYYSRMNFYTPDLFIKSNGDELVVDYFTTVMVMKFQYDLNLDFSSTNQNPYKTKVDVVFQHTYLGLVNDNDPTERYVCPNYNFFKCDETYKIIFPNFQNPKNLNAYFSECEDIYVSNIKEGVGLYNEIYSDENTKNTSFDNTYSYNQMSDNQTYFTSVDFKGNGDNGIELSKMQNDVALSALLTAVDLASYCYGPLNTAVGIFSSILGVITTAKDITDLAKTMDKNKIKSFGPSTTITFDDTTNNGNYVRSYGYDTGILEPFFNTKFVLSTSNTECEFSYYLSTNNRYDYKDFTISSLVEFSVYDSIQCRNLLLDTNHFNEFEVDNEINKEVEQNGAIDTVISFDKDVLAPGASSNVFIPSQTGFFTLSYGSAVNANELYINVIDVRNNACIGSSLYGDEAKTFYLKGGTRYAIEAVNKAYDRTSNNLYTDAAKNVKVLIHYNNTAAKNFVGTKDVFDNCEYFVKGNSIYTISSNFKAGETKIIAFNRCPSYLMAIHFILPLNCTSKPVNGARDYYFYEITSKFGGNINIIFALDTDSSFFVLSKQHMTDTSAGDIVKLSIANDLTTSDVLLISASNYSLAYRSSQNPTSLLLDGGKYYYVLVKSKELDYNLLSANKANKYALTFTLKQKYVKTGC